MKLENIKTTVRNAIITNSGTGATMTRLTLPKEWVDILKINKENSSLKLAFDGKKITIEKV